MGSFIQLLNSSNSHSFNKINHKLMFLQYHSLSPFQSLIFCLLLIQRIIIINTNMSRYETLEVSLQTDNNNVSRLSHTVDYDNQDSGEADERVKRFRELYYRNEKLRRELKILNAKLNQKLEKVKFPGVNNKKRALSVDLNRNPPSKALQRELQNAYKQVKMYKQQVELLKIKEESSENYAKFKDVENLISYKDKEIAQVQEQLKSIKNIKKIQERTIISDLENEEVKERLADYESELKQLKTKMKDMARKTRKRQEEYKKQQAYLVSLQKKARQLNQVDKGADEKPKFEKQLITNREISQQEWKDVKEELANQKKANDDVLKKNQLGRKQIKQIKQEHLEKAEQLKEKEALVKVLQLKIVSLNRLIRQQEKRDKEPPKNKLILKAEDIKEDLNDSFSEAEESQRQTISKDDFSLKKMLQEMESGQREWKGKFRKIEYGFAAPTDKRFQFQGQFIGLKVCLDENQMICGLICIFLDGRNRKYEQLQGSRSSIQLQWVIDEGDKIIKVSGSFTEQSYLHQLILISKNGKSGIFGSPSADPFTFAVKEDQRINGCLGSVRELGVDRKITELGFWIQKAN